MFQSKVLICKTRWERGTHTATQSPSTLRFFFSHFMHFANNGNKCSAKMYLNGIVRFGGKALVCVDVDGDGDDNWYERVFRALPSISASLHRPSRAFTYYLCVFRIWRQRTLDGIEYFECHICESKFFRCCCCRPLRRYFSSCSDDCHCWELDTELSFAVDLWVMTEKTNRSFFAECKLFFAFLLYTLNSGRRHFNTCDRIREMREAGHFSKQLQRNSFVMYCSSNFIYFGENIIKKVEICLFRRRRPLRYTHVCLFLSITGRLGTCEW